MPFNTEKSDNAFECLKQNVHLILRLFCEYLKRYDPYFAKTLHDSLHHLKPDDKPERMCIVLLDKLREFNPEAAKDFDDSGDNKKPTREVRNGLQKPYRFYRRSTPWWDHYL